jgi:hypothetical protein
MVFGFLLIAVGIIALLVKLDILTGVGLELRVAGRPDYPGAVLPVPEGCSGAARGTGSAGMTMVTRRRESKGLPTAASSP